MAGLNLQSADRVDRFVAETALVPTACHSLTGGSSNPPKFGTLIPNRIFVGGIPSNTTEQELKSFFSSFGQVKDVKIISDRLGVSKGSYGFVTFESQEMAEKIIKNESETLIFKDRKLNIGHAIRKQQMFPRADLPAALFFAGGAMPYSIQNGMAVFSLPGQEYPMLTQATAPYATMMLPQPGGGTTLYLPSAASATASPYAQLSQQQVTAALQQQHYQTAGITGGIAPSVAGQLTPVTVSGSNMNAQSNSTAAVMAAAAAAMAAAVQWPQQSAGNAHQTSQQLPSVTTHSVPQTAGTPQTMVQSASLTPQQAAAMAAAVAAQQAAWRWSPTVQQTQTSHATSSTHVSNTGSVTTASNAVGNTTSTPTIQNQSLHTHPQVSDSTLTLLQPGAVSLPATLRLTPPSVLTASTAALFAAAFQQPGANVLGTGASGIFDISPATALAVLASASMNNPGLLAPGLLYHTECSVDNGHQSAASLLNAGLSTLDASVQPSKKPRYDNDTPVKPERDSPTTLEASYA
ncbi:hypothetical protein CRM22_001898 [Opisthorchis felineus]|uniref:RRM domain-containing protein n=1 Tax=Opisthorchis felineus TaxID=147828 RepID=A0A4S2M8S9_OPIFE|nr:hypothetical protein CRM22_001898 [Opisthorchis felineus]